MKKIFIALSVAFAAFASCTKFSEDKPFVPDTVTDPAVAISDAQDSSFTFTVEPKNNSGYYSYAVIKGPASKALSAEEVLSLACKDKCVKIVVTDEDGVKSEVPVCGTNDCSKKKQVKLDVTGLIPNTTYTLYAVATSPKGVVSKLVSESVTTTDNLTPHALADKYGEVAVDDADIEDGVLYIKFNEPVVLTDDACATAHYHAVNAYGYDEDFGYTFAEVFSEDLPVDSLSVEEDVWLAVHVTKVPGAFVTITFPKGILKNGVGTESAALENNVVYYDGAFYFYGAGARFEAESFKLYRPYVEDPVKGKEIRMPVDTVLKFLDYAELEMTLEADSLITPEYNVLFDGESTWEENGVDFMLKTYSASTKRSVSTQADYFTEGTTLYFYLTEEPDFGTYVSYDIAEGSFEDIWGNTNEAVCNFDLSDEDAPIYGNYFYSCGYTVDDIIGKYTAGANNAYTDDPVELEFEIAASDDKEKGNVMFTNWMGAEGKLYADFDVDFGTLTIAQKIFNEDNCVPFFYDSEGPELLSVPAAGVLTNQSYYMGLAVVEDGELNPVVGPEGAPMLYYNIYAERE